MENRSDVSRQVIGWTAAGALLATVYAANWAIETWGVIDLPLTGLSAPAGVLFAGLAFGLRDIIHEIIGRRVVVAVILAGAVLSYVLSDAARIPGGVTSIAVASGVAFLLSELADLAVYSPLRERHWVGAVVVSNVAGAVVDSALFLWLAFASLEFLPGQVVGKMAMTAPVVVVMWVVRRGE